LYPSDADALVTETEDKVVPPEGLPLSTFATFTLLALGGDGLCSGTIGPGADDKYCDTEVGDSLDNEVEQTDI